MFLKRICIWCLSELCVSFPFVLICLLLFINYLCIKYSIPYLASSKSVISNENIIFPHLLFAFFPTPAIW